MKELVIYFYDNKIGDDGVKEFSLALKELKLLNSLTIDFCDNKIGNDGAK